MKKKLEDRLEDHMMQIEGLDDCIIGIAERCDSPNLLAYDAKKIFQKLVNGGMTEKEAVDFYLEKISGVNVGEGTPIFIHKI